MRQMKREDIILMTMISTHNIEGIGNDIIEIARIKKSIERHGKSFLDRLFTEKEQAHCTQYKDAASHFAGRFAAKEAISKALGTGFGKELSWQEIEILNDEKGKPIVFLSKRLEEKKILLSISHSESHAIATALCFSKEKKEEDS